MSLVDRPAPSPSAGDNAAPPAADAEGRPALALADVSVGYGGEPVVAGVSFDVGAGRWLAVIGPNGAGKSTLLKAIAGVVAHQGTILVGNAAVNGPTVTRSRAAIRGIGYVPQHPVLPVGMTTAEYVLLGRTAHLGWFGSESRRDRHRVAEVLDQLDLGPLAGRPVTELSGGEAQRATLARVLVQEPCILVLDEPTSALDLAHQIAVLERIDGLRRDHGLAVVTAMHDLTIAGRFADELLLVAGGGAAASGPPAEVLTGEVLTRYYGTPVEVLDGADGAVVVPLRTATNGDGPPPTDTATTPPPDRGGRR